jgi:hypothetical protein
MRKQNRLNVVYPQFFGYIVKVDFPFVLAFINAVFLGNLDNFFKMIHQVHVFGSRFILGRFYFERKNFVLYGGKIKFHSGPPFLPDSPLGNPAEITILAPSAKFSGHAITITPPVNHEVMGQKNFFEGRNVAGLSFCDKPM